MSFDPAYLFWSFVFSVVGIAYFRYGKKQAEIPMIIAGVVLMIYPYFFDSFWWVLGLGTVISAAPWILARGI